HPKMVGGQSLGCASFAALLKHLVEAMNESKQLSVKGAWDAVQHTTCGGLADELRGIASQKLKLLKSGQALPDGTQLPMTDEALRAFFRNQRHELKDRWEEQAVGDEEVRKEYWQELKETLAREELQVRQQNGRLADQQLSQSLKLWQDWLDNSEGTIEEGEKISADLGKLLEHLPTTTVARAGRAAIEAAARRVAGARTAVVATVEQSAEAQRRALAWGEQAAKLEGNVRAELEATKAAIKKAADRWRQASQSKEAKTVELQGKAAEHEDGQQQLQSAQAELEEARARETELQVLNRSGQEKEQTLQQELEAARAMASKASAERLASQRCNEAAAEAAGRQNLQLQE
ncbi:GBP2, partial [Symbiodinium necroappetens]